MRTVHLTNVCALTIALGAIPTMLPAQTVLQQQPPQTSRSAALRAPESPALPKLHDDEPPAAKKPEAKKAEVKKEEPKKEAPKPEPKQDTVASPDAQATPASQLSPADKLIKEAFSVSKNAKKTEEYTQIIDLCTEAISRGAANADYARKLSAWAHNRRGELYADEGKDREALEEFEAAVKLDPTLWRAIHNRGVSKASIGDLKAAIADFDRTIEMSPNYANAWFNRGELKYDQGDFAGAAADYTRAIQIQPRDAGFYNSRGHAYYRLAQFREALSDYNRAVQLNPEDAAILVNRGDAFREQAMYAPAASDFKDAIRINPQLGRAYVSAAWLMVTCPDERYRNTELGLQAAKKAIELDGTRDYRYLDTLAAAHANAGDFTEAQKVASQALDAAPAREKDRLKERIQLYQKSEAYREGAPAEPMRAAARPQTSRRDQATD